MVALMKFLFPSHLEHPESTGRLDIFAHYGSVDEDGYLRGGSQGNHIHTDLEIRQMIKELNRETLLGLLGRPRETVETMINELLPKAIAHHYTEREVNVLFGGVSEDENGRRSFADLQRVVLADQRRRLLTLIRGGEIFRSSRKAIPYQTKPAEILTAMTRKTKLLPNQEFIVRTKKLHAQAQLIAPLEQQNLSQQLAANVQLTTGLGDVNDRWDRYCALRRTGKVSYVKARNIPRRFPYADGEKGEKADTCSSLISTLSLNGPLGPRC
jgi:hypothetical protein